VKPMHAANDDETDEMEMAARAIGRKLLVVRAGSEDDLAGAFASVVREGAGALILQSDPFLNSRPGRLAVLSARYGIPTMSPLREYPAAGGLMSYRASLAEAVHLAGVYCGRILKGERPAHLPGQPGTKGEPVINLGTAKTPGR